MGGGGGFGSGNSYSTIPFMVSHPVDTFWVFVLELNPWHPYASCARGPAVACKFSCFSLDLLGEASLHFFFCDGWGGAAVEGRLRHGMRCRFNIFAMRFYSPTAIKQFLSALKCVYM